MPTGITQVSDGDDEGTDPDVLVSELTGFPFPTGNPTIVILICFFSGIQLLSLGVMAEYVGRIYDEVKRRPRFILESSHGIERLNAPERERVTVETVIDE